MSQVSYYQESSVQDAMSVVAKWMGRNYGLQVVYHDGTSVDADIFRGVIRIPRLACSGGLTEEALMLLRGRVYHEAGHIAYTNLDKSEYPKGIVFEIFNAVEDRREERRVTEEFPGAGAIFRAMMTYHNKKIAERAVAGNIDGAIWEALVGMSFQSEGIAPAWRLSEKAKRYFDVAYDKFCEWKGLPDARSGIALSEEIYELMKEAHEDYKREQEEQEQSEESQESESGESEEGDSEEEHEDEDDGEGNGQGSGGDESEDDEEGDSEDGSGSDSEEDDESEGSEEGDSEDGSGSEEDSEDGEEVSGSGSDFDDEEDEPGEDSESGDSGSPGESGDEESEGSEEPEAGDVAGNEEYEPSDDGDSKTSESEEYDPEVLEREMEEELEGISLEELQDEDIKQALNELDPADTEYLSRRDDDEHVTIDGGDVERAIFKRDRESISTTVATMTASLVQALRARTRSRKDAHKRQGRIDNRRLVQIAKNLSKEVFYQTRPGIELDTAVEIVIDESISMREYRAVRLAAIAIGEALSQVGIPFEVTGTTTKYIGGGPVPLGGFDRTNPLVYKHYKTFSQGWMQVRHNLSRSGKTHHNVDGETVGYAARRLAARPEARKIVFSLSDGQPDAGHCNGAVMGRNLIRTCERARAAGIEVYGIGIGTREPSAFYGSENFIYVEDVEADLAAAFVGVVGMGVMGL